jgi:beta-phosphoglucomutase-like phosphatase (HAD superfamily)
VTGPARGNRVPAAVRAALQVILCDADGNLFPSEEPAFAASAGVTNRMLAAAGGSGRFTGEELRQATTGLNFRTTAQTLITRLGLPMPDLERWVEEEKRVVTAHLSRTLRPDPQVIGPLATLAGRYRLAAVSSSALSRLDACFRATGLDTLLGPAVRFSAEDSLPAPASKPDPAVYRHACEQLGIPPAAGLAVEDSVAGVRSAVAAGCPAVGNVTFVPAAERSERAAELREAGVLAIVPSWSRLAELLAPAAVAAGGDR